VECRRSGDLAFREEFQGWRSGESRCEDFHTLVSDHNSVLELSRAHAIASRGGPVVFPSKVFPGALIHHGLDCEDMALLHEAHCFV